NADVAAEIFAERLSAAAAPLALSAYEVEINRCAIANFDIGHTLADGDNVAAQFMPHNARPTPAARICMTASPGFGSGVGRSSMAKASPQFRTTAAFMGIARRFTS